MKYIIRFEANMPVIVSIRSRRNSLSVAPCAGADFVIRTALLPLPAMLATRLGTECHDSRFWISAVRSPKLLRELRLDIYARHPRAELTRLTSGAAIRDLQADIERTR